MVSVHRVYCHWPTDVARLRTGIAAAIGADEFHRHAIHPFGGEKFRVVTALIDVDWPELRLRGLSPGPISNGDFSSHRP